MSEYPATQLADRRFRTVPPSIRTTLVAGRPEASFDGRSSPRLTSKSVFLRRTYNARPSFSERVERFLLLPDTHGRHLCERSERAACISLFGICFHSLAWRLSHVYQYTLVFLLCPGAIRLGLWIGSLQLHIGRGSVLWRRCIWHINCLHRTNPIASLDETFGAHNSAARPA